jgi:hypothetical protein
MISKNQLQNITKSPHLFFRDGTRVGTGTGKPGFLNEF